jgi:hypothetical protein
MRAILSAFQTAKSVHQVDDKADEQNQPKPTAADSGTSKAKPATAAQEKKNNQE